MSDAGTDWARLVHVASHSILEHIEELTSLDSVVGDGDHGVNLQAGLEAALADLDAAESPTAPDVLRITGTALQESMAGTAGLLLGRFFTVASKAIADRFDAPTIATVLRSGTDEMIKRGKAQLGDRSMIDALEPAAQAAGTVSEAGGTPTEVLRAAAEAARTGAEETSRMVPRVGRASRASTEPTGRPDAGAVSVTLMLEGWAEAMNRSESDV
jgi:dihydroxyacetone kinase-like protein